MMDSLECFQHKAIECFLRHDISENVVAKLMLVMPIGDPVMSYLLEKRSDCLLRCHTSWIFLAHFSIEICFDLTTRPIYKVNFV